MSRFDSYFLMKSEDAIDYVKEKVPQFSWDASSMHSKEIGDGNLNYVFRVWDNKGNSIIIKQAGCTARISEDMVLSTDRNRIESEILILEGKLANGFVPKIYFFDVNMSACAEEDLTGHEIMRTCLLRHEIFPKFAEDISTFMANTLMGTTDIVMNHKEKKELQRKFINPELCEITEDLVYTEPYNNCANRNNIFAPNEEFVKKELYDDEELHLEIAKLKTDFMCNAQSILHGDLHTGSVFITKESTIVIDPEFAFYGPMGYDIGNVIANMIFAWCNGDAEINDNAKRKEFCGWVEQVIVEVIDKTMAKMKDYYQEHVTDAMAKSKGYMEYYISTILADTSGVTGLELNRRTVGMANVKDLTTISDEKKRIRAERICILAGKHYIKERANMKCGADFLKVLKYMESSVAL
jgi:5-methylthioribose kinase